MYLQKVLGYKEAVKEVSLIGKIKHKVFELSGKEDREIMSKLTYAYSLDDLEMEYRRVYYNVLKFVILFHKKEIKELNLKSLKIYQDLWPFFLEEGRTKSKELYDFSKEKGLYGDALWLALPKGVPELLIKSEKLGLIGVVDRVEVDNGFKPVEIKTGKAPRDGVWKNHLIQVGAYMMLLSEHYGQKVNAGYVEYVAIGEKREVRMNEFLKDEILELINKVNSLLESSSVPEKVEEQWKCASCGIKEQCYAL